MFRYFAESRLKLTKEVDLKTLTNFVSLFRLVLSTNLTMNTDTDKLAAVDKYLSKLCNVAYF